MSRPSKRPSETVFPLVPLGRIVKKAGAERVSADAKVELAKWMEQYASRIAKEAIKLAGHARRKTVKAIDIRMAAESVR
ncbi:hypothetical protein ES705_27254 [subsurface metagenome]